MPNIAKEPLHRKADSMIFGERFIIKGHLQYRHRLDRFLSTDLIQKACSHNEDITSEKFSDNGKEEINTTGQQQAQQQSPHHSSQQEQHSEQHLRPQRRRQQGQHLEQHQDPQHRVQNGRHSERHQESQHRRHQDKHSERHFGNIFFNEIIYLPLA